MHVFDRNAQSLQMKVLAGEIPQTADTALYQTVCDTRASPRGMVSTATSGLLRSRELITEETVLHRVSLIIQKA